MTPRTSNGFRIERPKASAPNTGKAEHVRVRFFGTWRSSGLDYAATPLKKIERLPEDTILLDVSQIDAIDTSGAIILHDLLNRLNAKGKHAHFGTIPERLGIINQVASIMECQPPKPERESFFVELVVRLGKATHDFFGECLTLISFIGAVSLSLASLVIHPKRLRVKSLIRHIDNVGADAMPIVGLIAFLIAVVLAYQGASQLKRFGADIFMIDLVAVSVLREMGVLLTAIMVAGRSGSAFTAEIGAMKVNEEIDAMKTLGLDPVHVLVVPRVLALIIALPLLTFFADMMGLIGGYFMAYILLDISLTQYLQRLQGVIGNWHFWVGIIKAPFFALMIGLVACLRGLEVKGTAESLGKKTTSSVVESIFLVIVVDALFSILFAELKI